MKSTMSLSKSAHTGGSGVEGPPAEPVTPVIEQGVPRALSDILEKNGVGEASFTLNKSTEDLWEELVRQHFTSFQDAPAGAMEEWQETFTDVFRKRIEAAAGNKPFDLIPPTERTRLIAQEAKAFALDNKNAELINKIDALNLRAFEKGLNTGVSASETLDRSVTMLTPSRISGGKSVDRYRGANPINTLTGKVARRLTNNQAVVLPEWANRWFDSNGKKRPMWVRHLSNSEQSRNAATIHARQVDNVTNKASDYNVEFPPPGSRVVDFTGLSQAEVIILKSFGLHNGEDCDARTVPIDPSKRKPDDEREEQTLTNAIEDRIKALTEARVNFYNKTGLDISRINLDLRDPMLVQDPHTQIERETEEALAALGPYTPEQLRLEISNNIAKAVEQRTAKALAEDALNKEEERKRRIVKSIIENANNPKDEATIEAERKRLQDKLKEEEERLKKAQARELIEEQREAAQKLVDEVEGEYVQADFDAYDQWLVEKELEEDGITNLKGLIAEYETVLADIPTLRASVAKLDSDIAGLTLPAGNKGTPPSDETVAFAKRKLEDLIRRRNTEKKKLEDVEQAKDAAGNAINNARLGRLRNELAQAEAKKTRLAPGPKDWPPEKTTAIESRKRKKLEIDGIDSRIKTGIAKGRFVKESSEEIEERLVEIRGQIAKVAEPDESIKYRGEAYEAYIDLVTSKDALEELPGRLELMRSGGLELKYSRFYENNPESWLRALQGAFGSRVLEDPVAFSKATKLLPPEKFMILYNLNHATAPLTDADFDTLPAGAITAEDIQFILGALEFEAIDSESLGLITPLEEHNLGLIKDVLPNSRTTKPDVARVQQLEQYLYYYRDVADLQLRVLTEMAFDAGLDYDAYFDPSVGTNKKLIQEAALYAQDIDKLRKKRRTLFYGNTGVAGSTPLPPKITEPETP